MKQFLKQVLPEDVLFSAHRFIIWARDVYRKNTYKYYGSNQWDENNTHNMNVYYDLMTLDYMSIKEKYPSYFERLEQTIPCATGHVLEIGCGSGNITRWIVKKEDVFHIVAVDAFQKPLEMLAKTLSKYEKKITTHCSTMGEFVSNQLFDSVMLCEIIEHINQHEEYTFLKNIQNNLIKYEAPYTPGYSATRWVVSTPIGFMPDPHHLRGFSKAQFIRHLERNYGVIKGISYNDCQQTAWGYFRLPR